MKQHGVLKNKMMLKKKNSKLQKKKHYDFIYLKLRCAKLNHMLLRRLNM